jgi:nucleotide-binding universal stress UspA family protein
MKILLFVADEPVPAAAVSMAGYLTRLTESSLTLLYVPPPEVNQVAENQVVDQIKHAIPDIDVDVRLYHGRATGRLIEEAKEETYDLVVMAMRQISYLRRRLIGSRSRAILREGHNSVLIAKQRDTKLKRILICTSGAAVAEPVVEAGGRLAGAVGAQVTLLHVAPVFPHMYRGLPEIDESISELLDTETPVARHLRRGAEILAQVGVDSELELRRGVVPDEILQEASEGNYDLIVIGASAPRGGFQYWLLGDVAWEIVQGSDCHVLVVRHEEAIFEELD